MRYTLLGRSGLRVSELALGTMTFGDGWGWGASKEESRRMLDTFLDAGGNFVDTADFYVDGTAEAYVGEFLADRRTRDQVVLLSKYNSASPPTTDPNATGNSRKHLRLALEASLRRLRTDHLDVYVVHVPDFLTPLEELMRALDDQVRAGKILYPGVSDFPAWQVARAHTLAEERGWSPFVLNTLQYSLVERTPERELLPMAGALDIGVTSWSPLGAGLLTGRYDRSADPASPAGGQDDRGGRARAAGGGEFRRLDVLPMIPVNERNLGIAAEVTRLAAELGCTPAQLALAWVRSRGVIPVLGARTAAQLAENLGCLDVVLGAAHLDRLDELSRVGLGFPHDFLAEPAIRAGVYGGLFDRIDTRHPESLPADLLAGPRRPAPAKNQENTP